MSIFSDIALFFKKLNYIPYLKFSNHEDVEVHDKLMRSCPQMIRSKTYSIYQHLIPRVHLNDHKVLEICSNKQYSHDNDNQTVFFINGIMTTENKCLMHIHMLSEVLKHKVIGLYNPTNGILIDVFESILGRSFNIREPITKSFAKTVREKLLSTTGPVILIGHSQGAIIISNLIKLLKQHKEAARQLHRLHIYTFGSGADELEYMPHMPVHFANTKDFIAQIGILGNKRRVYGTLIEKDRYGHSFVKSYLPGFLSGEYGKDNPLYQTFRKH